MLKQIGVPHQDAAEIYCDNLSAVHLTANPVLHKKSKHFMTHYHFAREKVADGSLIVYHVPAAQQIADIFTKSLPQQSFFDLRYKLGVDLPPTSSLRGGIKPNRASLTRPTDKTLGFPHIKPKQTVTKGQSSATVTKAVNRVKQEDKRTVMQPYQTQLSNRFQALQVEDE
ncbi:Protein kinase domain-containing protein [Raphanus sativus]|nr:Protein kinase domain-containing protein [Raphanus sativus]